MPSTRTFLTVPEAAELLRVETSTLYRAIRAEEFPAVRIRAESSSAPWPRTEPRPTDASDGLSATCGVRSA
ncbi:helix-turn-helix domain-containing protein [Pseudonocardia pini]|uniref:helix-turn-helix domain-containing protein n=1 Tax=Pseudonocardia pini TaxID=2758030 RepID=UPI0015EFE7FE|nr:helix-turn-helix domain-containing protein [Pseudonocardia pini]